MRVLFTSHGAYGHFHPIAPLALAAKARGHEVVVATGPDLVEWVRGCGLPAEKVGLAHGEHERRLAELTIGDPGLGVFHRFSTVAVPATLADLVRLGEVWRPDVIVHEEGEYSAPLYAGMLGIPCVTHSWPAPARPEAERDTYRELLSPIWAANGIEHLTRTSGDVYLDSCPPSYQSNEIRSIPGVVPIRAVVFDGPPSPLPRWLAELPRPAAYVTLGTVRFFSEPEMLRFAVEAVEPLVAAVVVTTGPNPPEVVETHGDHIRVERYLPQSQILPRVDLVVSHGGAGTTLGSLVHGLPHLVVPGKAESQLRNAERTEALGVGTAVSRGTASPETLRAAAQQLLTDPSYCSAAAAARDTIDALPTVDSAVGLLERLAP